MEKDFYQRFGQKLRKARKSSGLSQEDLGKAVGLNRTSVSNIEKGRQKILLHTFCEALRVLNLEPKDLLPLPTEIKQPAKLDLSEYQPAVRAFIEKGIGLQSRSKSNVNSALQNSETRARTAR